MGDGADDAFERAERDDENAYSITMGLGPLPGYEDSDQEQEYFERANVAPQTVNCPKCGGPMHICTVHDTGGRFMGCNRYPRCRGSRPVPQSVSTAKANESIMKLVKGIGCHADDALSGSIGAVEYHLNEIQNLVQTLKGRLNAKT